MQFLQLLQSGTVSWAPFEIILNDLGGQLEKSAHSKRNVENAD